MGWLSAAAGIAGSLLSSRSSDKDREAQQEQAQLNYEQQKEFAQNSIQWKAEDAKKAGLHPLFAMGAPLTAYSPSSFTPVGDGGSGLALAEAGRSLDSAISQRSVQAAKKHQLSFTKRMNESKLRQNVLQEDLMRADLHKSQFELALLQNQQSNKSASGNPLEEGFKQQMEAEGNVKNYPGQTSVKGKPYKIREPGIVKRLEPHYGEEVSQIPGAIQMGRDYLQNKLQKSDLPEWRSFDKHSPKYKKRQKYYRDKFEGWRELLNW
jgi:hypothetical protein